MRGVVDHRASGGYRQSALAAATNGHQSLDSDMELLFRGVQMGSTVVLILRLGNVMRSVLVGWQWQVAGAFVFIATTVPRPAGFRSPLSPRPLSRDSHLSLLI